MSAHVDLGNDGTLYHCHWKWISQVLADCRLSGCYAASTRSTKLLAFAAITLAVDHSTVAAWQNGYWLGLSV
jgi:hypothetical protein